MSGRKLGAALLRDILGTYTPPCWAVGHRWDNQKHHGSAVRLCVRCAAIEWHR